MMYVIRLSWLISLAITFFGFLIVNQLFETEVSGTTGNLGFICMIFLFPFILLSLFTTFRYFLTVVRIRKNRGKWLVIYGGLLLTAFFLYLFMDMKNSIGASLFEISEETGQLYFDVYTFGLIHSISGVLGALYGSFNPTTQEIDERPSK